ncbi:uncharacterized protein LOC127870305 isoform X2 [Dreissena polymorpha]|uniref:uncharacterized protein LOC127870305 isoform X2 n=1 Tax=Dreissena polymorpha TaxID=45954 RepID=UPI0022647CAE|nr:uncharacterized protein LOC127870305 isoform X2 [Dreissena polymorpha]
MDFNVAAKLSNANMLRIILICSLTAHVIGNQRTQNTWLEVGVVCSSTVQVTCSGVGVTQQWNIYKTSATHQQEGNMIKVVQNGTKCDTKSIETIKSSQCMCLHDTHISCNLSYEGIANEGDLWKCTRFSHGSIYRSNTIRLPSQQISICSTTSVPEIVTENDSSTKNDLHMKTVTQVTETVITETLVNDPLKRNSTIIMISATGILFLLATTFLICVYRRYRTRTAVMPSCESTGTVGQIIESVMSTEHFSTEHQVDHYEQIPIMDMPPLAESFPLTNEAETQIDMLESGADQRDTSIHYYEFMPDTASANEADVNDVQTISEAQAGDPIRYESLLETRTAGETDYS